MSKTLIAGVALAAAVLATQSADAGHRRYRPCVPVYRAQSGGWYQTQAPRGYYVPMAPSASPATPATGQPPIAQGPGQTIRRFSEEPGVEPAPAEQAVAPQAVAPAAPAYRPAPAVQAEPRYPSSTPSRNPVERRLRPGRGWQR